MTIRELKQLIAEFPNDEAKIVIQVLDNGTLYAELGKVNLKEVSNNRVMVTLEELEGK